MSEETSVRRILDTAREIRDTYEEFTVGCGSIIGQLWERLDEDIDQADQEYAATLLVAKERDAMLEERDMLIERLAQVEIELELQGYNRR